ncbi:MAG: hypothetical protein ACKOAS_00470 [Verrucomicrobiota bacterium]
MKPSLLIAVLITFALGVLVGRFSAGGKNGEAPAEEKPHGISESPGQDAALEKIFVTEKPAVPLQPIRSGEFLALFEEATDRDGFFGVFEEIENRAGVSDFNTLAAAVQEAPPGTAREAALRTLMRAFAEKNPAQALGFAQQLAAGREKDLALRALFSAAAKNDPQGAIGLVATIADPAERTMALGAAVSSWASRDPAAAIGYVSTVAEESLRPALFRDIALRTRKNSRQIFDAVLANVPTGSMFEQSIYGVMANWSRSDPQAAAAAIGEIPRGALSTSAALLVARNWAESTTDKGKVLEWARGLPQGEIRTGAMGRVFESWGRTNAEAALLEFEKLPPDQRKEAALSLAGGWGRKNPTAALAWAERLPDPSQSLNAIGVVVTAWVGNQPAEAAKYVAGLPVDRRSEVLPKLVMAWTSSNAEAAAQWLSAQPIAPERDGAVEVLVRKIAREDPETAMGWSNGIVNPEKRGHTASQIAREWMRVDPAAARDWIGKSNLPEQLRKELLEN